MENHINIINNISMKYSKYITIKFEYDNYHMKFYLRQYNIYNYFGTFEIIEFEIL